MTGFTKLYSSILDSSIWSEDLCTRVVWISFMAKADKNGMVIAAPDRMASAANVPLSKFKASLQKLMAPDPDSKTPDNEGRRLEKIQGGWQILNYKLYREMGRAQERKDYLRQKKREERAKKRDVNTLSTPVNNSQHCQPIAEAKAEAEAKKKPSVRFDYENRILTGLTDEDYSFWEEAFPAVNIRQDIKSAVQWLIDNPKKRKKQLRRFFSNWLRRTQEKGGNGANPARATVAEHMTKLKSEGRI